MNNRKIILEGLLKKYGVKLDSDEANEIKEGLSCMTSFDEEDFSVVYDIVVGDEQYRNFLPDAEVDEMFENTYVVRLHYKKNTTGVPRRSY